MIELDDSPALDVRQSTRYRTPESRLLDRAVDMERAQKRRQDVMDFLGGCLFGIVLLLVVSAPWDRLS